MSSAGQAIGGIAGAVVGFFTPLGPVYGAQIGMMIGGVLDPPRTEGPRLEDLNTQTSVYGAFIPRLYGTTAVTGNVLWIQGDRLIERSHEEGGKGGPEVTVFEYFATFAVGLCEGPIDGVRRIWIGGQLWYDAGSDDLSTIIASNESAALFTLYPGTDTQLADPLIQADRGAANVPAYRGLAYIVFEALPLKDYGNSLMGAQVKVELVKQAVNGWATHAIATTEKLIGAPIPTTLGNPSAVRYPVMALDGTFMFVFTYYNFLGYVAVYEIKETVQRRVNPEFLVATTQDPPAQGYSKVGPRCLYRSASTSYRLFGLEGDIYEVNLLADYGASTASYHEDEDGFVYVCRLDVTTLPLIKFRQYSGSVYGTITATQPTGIGVRVKHIDSYGDHLYLILDEATTGIHRVQKYLKSDLTFVEEIQVPVTFTGTGSGTGTERRIHVVGVNHFYLSLESTINTANAVFVEYDGGVTTKLTPDAGVPVADNQIDFRSINGSFFMTGFLGSGVGNALWLASTYMPGTNPTPLSTIVESEALQTDLLTAGDLDVTELADQVRGYRISSLAPLRGGIDQLRKAWPFDAIQHGYQIKFKKRGGASVATITEGELDARAAGADPGVRISNTREMDLVMPQQLTVQYMDATREYDVNVAEESR